MWTELSDPRRRRLLDGEVGLGARYHRRYLHCAANVGSRGKLMTVSKDIAELIVRLVCCKTARRGK